MSGKKILIVEDEEPLRNAVVMKLSKEGFTVIEARDGLEGMMRAKHENPDLILLDIVMPKMDGFTMLKELKAHDALKGIPVLMLTNLGQEEDIELGKSLGAVDFLIKANWKMVDIIEKIKKVLK